MKRTSENTAYREVNSLPKRALTVAEYADIRSISEPHVYKLWRQHIQDGKKVGFEIILFKGRNYVLLE